MPKDKFSNFAFGQALESVAGTMAFSEIQSGVAIFEKVAWVISRIEYNVPVAYANLLLDEADSIQENA